MSLVGLALLIALCIPIVALVIDSPIGRAIARRLDRSSGADGIGEGEVASLRDRLAVLESEVETLQHTVGQLHDENEFLQRLLEEGPTRPPLPPGPT